MDFHCAVLPPRRPERMTRFALLAEELGYDRFWIADQTFHADPFQLLQFAAQEASLPMGLAVTSPFSRHPVQIARSIATLAHLRPRSDWVVALGTANPHHVLSRMGLELRNSAETIVAAVEVIRALLAGETVSYSSADVTFELRDVTLDIDSPPPVRIYVGTRGPRTLRKAGAVADGMIVEAMFLPALVRWAKEQIEAETQGEVGSREYVAWQVTQVLDPGEPLPASAVSFAQMLMRTTARATLEMLGFGPDLIEDLKSGRDVQVPPHHVQQFVAAGTAEELRAMVEAAAEAGADSWSCVFTGDEETAMTAMKRFAVEVISPMRGG